jgi:hypothetical protein
MKASLEVSTRIEVDFNICIYIYIYHMYICIFIYIYIDMYMFKYNIYICMSSINDFMLAAQLGFLDLRRKWGGHTS